MRNEWTFRQVKAGLVLAAVAVVAGCKTGVTKPDDFVQVTEAEIGNYLGKTLELNGNYIVLAEGGVFSGRWNNASIAGTWAMKDGYWCRVLTEFFEADKLNREDCQLWEASGSQLRGTRDKGQGQNFIYHVK